ncbi:hypothetical protein lpl1901 [Legionella pneumophila str. Lens]|uniref:Uncharacterized protein n=1 Tax=Legionella pneumophila (strain Lens) TaxID=297245 RepID=Q5WVB5_LEGPL|nr:hypothetical protein lpl1901 [Legionella pneumophila str. Lens]
MLTTNQILILALIKIITAHHRELANAENDCDNMKCSKCQHALLDKLNSV